MKTYCVYIATNQRDTVFYTGMTSNLQTRIWQHKNKVVEGFTKRYNIYKLVYYEVFPTPIDAIVAEKKIKGWTRKKKINLISRDNPEFNDLSEEL